MGSHRSHILSPDLVEVFDYLVTQGHESNSFELRENTPKGKNRKRAVNYYYAGRSTNPFAFIVNSGERKDYHLFYIRTPRSGDIDVVRSLLDSPKIDINPRGEITIKVKTLTDAEAVWKVVERVKLG